MKILSLLSYTIGSLLMIVSCLAGVATATWLLGIAALTFLSIGCVFQFAENRHRVYAPSVIRVQAPQNKH